MVEYTIHSSSYIKRFPFLFLFRFHVMLTYLFILRVVIYHYTHHLLKVHFNIILSYSPRIPKWSLPLRVSD